MFYKSFKNQFSCDLFMKFSIVKSIKDIKGKKEPVFIESASYKELRQAVEKNMVNGLIHTEFYPKKDSVHYRRSGIDDILARFMGEKKVKYVIDIKTILESEYPEVSLGRVIQNIMLCKKYNVDVVVVNSEFDGEIIISFLECLGMEKRKAKTVISR